VGAYIDAGGAQHGFLLDDGIFTQIDFPGGAINIARGINDRGQIVGTFSDAQGVIRSYLLDDGAFTQIDFPAGTGTTTNGINGRGQIVGTFFDANGLPHGILLDKGVFTELDLPGPLSVAATINDRSQIVGAFGVAIEQAHGFLLDHGVFSQINFPGATFTSANGINDRGQIVGAFGEVIQQAHGFLLDHGVFSQINFPGATATILAGINNRGQIVGRLADASGAQHGFLATKEQFNGNASGLGADGNNAAVEIAGTFTSPTDLDLSAATLTVASLLNEQAGGGELAEGLPLVLTAAPGSRRKLALFVDRSRPNIASVTILDAGSGKFIFKIKVLDATINSPQNCPTRLTTGFRLEAASKPPIIVSTERSWTCFGPSDRFLKTH
jgi:probable HAF family extracellular repeat protein